MQATDAELEATIALGEGERCEFKPSLSQKDDIFKDICAFSNDLPGSGQPGYVFVGLNDDASCAGLAIMDDLLNQIGQMRLQGKVTPFPTMGVEKRRLRGGEVAVIEVQPHRYPPVRYEGRCWVRVGTTRQVASQQEEIRLAERRRTGDIAFVYREALGSDLSDLDLDYCARAYIPAAISRDVLQENERSLHQQLASLRLLTSDAAMPTYGGLLLAGYKPSAHVPGARLEFTRFEGTDRSGVIRTSNTLDAGLFRVFEQIEELLPLYIEVRLSPGEGLRHVKQAAYPAWALREYVLNGLIHRNYEGTAAAVRVDWFDDRVEVTSPGGLYGHVTPQNFRHMNDYRNELLAAAAKTMGWVEKVGQGIARAERLLQDNGNPAPDYAFDDHYVLVTVRRAAA
jgi:ATP-dependent DNA helicase RecG